MTAPVAGGEPSAGGTGSFAQVCCWGGYRIFRNPLRSSTLRLEDFQGAFMPLTGAAGLFTYNRSISVTIFGAPAWLGGAFSPTMPGVQLPMLVASCQGLDVLWGEIIDTMAAAASETG